MQKGQGRMLMHSSLCLLHYLVSANRFSCAAFAAIIWAFSQLLGLPDTAMYVLMALGLIPVIWSTIWVAGRAWHVEQLLETGRDVDRPVFRAFYYFKKR